MMRLAIGLVMVLVGCGPLHQDVMFINSDGGKRQYECVKKPPYDIYCIEKEE